MVLLWVWESEGEAMIDKRHKNQNWELPTQADGRIETWQAVGIAVLMDIRAELQELNALLHCKNFTGIPVALADIKANTTPKKPRKAKKKP